MSGPKERKSQKNRRMQSLPVAIATAARTMRIEIDGLAALASALDGELAEPFEAAVALMRSARGRIIISGLGKSGLIGRKIAATLSSTGTPAYFVHASEASHGDLGMITRDDVVLALSWSGETVELASMIAYAHRFAVPIVAITSRKDSSLARASAVSLVLPRVAEACPHGLAPTTSSLMQLALGDCLAMALLEGNGFTAYDFKEFHPGGQLGANLRHLRDLMQSGDRLPLVTAQMVMSEAIVVMSQKGLGCLGIVDGKGRLTGIITDGDLRRHMGDGLMRQRTGDIMTKRPKTALTRHAGIGGAGVHELVEDHDLVRRRRRPAGRHHSCPRPAPRRGCLTQLTPRKGSAVRATGGRQLRRSTCPRVCARRAAI